ncbi:MAG: Ig-like domain-containing protein, partial [Micrococcales bacterium]
MAKHRASTAVKNFTAQLAVLLLSIASLLVGGLNAQAAPVALTVTHIGWDVVGLDSNDVTDGPNTFPQGYRVCNTSTDTDATNVEADWTWTSTNNLITVDGNTNRQLGTIAANSCADFYWTVTIARDSNAYDTSRNYKVSVTDGTVSADTGTQLIYVEHLVSQNRNVVDGVSGPTAVTLGDTVQFVLTGATATQGYEQIVTAPILTSSIFEITSVSSSYAVGGNTTGFYFDACQWDPAGFDVSSWACLSTGKAGGDPITVTVTAKVIGIGTAAVGGVIYDFSGSSFHYNSDYSAGVLTVIASAPVKSINAVDDSDSTNVNTSVDVDVLNNDTATNATVKVGSVTITQQPAHGTVSVDALTGKVTYTPNNGYTGTDTFKYSIETNEDASVTDEATVTITIAAPAVQPVATDDADTTPVDTPVEVNVLSNDTPGSNPLDPTSVSITAQPSHGTVSVDPVTGKITYTPNSGYTGADN